MRLKEIYLKEGRGDVYSFVHEKWDGNEPKGLHVEPFNVLVKYHGEHGGSSKHPYGEGDAEEQHSDDIQILSLTADEPVKITSEEGPHLEQLHDMENIHALVVGKMGKGTLARVLGQFPDAAVLKASDLENGTKGALQIFNFIEDHADSDVVVDVGTSNALKDIHQVVVIKALLQDGIISYHVVGSEKIVQFNGRLVIVAHDLHEIDDSIERRCVKIDLTKDQFYPRGTALQDIPGWEESSIEFFEDKAQANFTGQ